MSAELVIAMMEFVDFERRELQAVYDDIPEDEIHARIRVTQALARLVTERGRLETNLKSVPQGLVEMENADGRRGAATGLNEEEQ